MTQRSVTAAVVVIVASLGCTEGRSLAAGELLRFERAVRAHEREHGRQPLTVDPGLPADSANLPYRSRAGVVLQILPREDGYEATATYQGWTCSMRMGGASRTAPDCFPR